MAAPPSQNHEWQNMLNQASRDSQLCDGGCPSWLQDLAELCGEIASCAQRLQVCSTRVEPSVRGGAEQVGRSSSL